MVKSVRLPPEFETRLSEVESRVQREIIELGEIDLEESLGESELLDSWDDPSIVRHVEDAQRATAATQRTVQRARRESQVQVRRRLSSKGA